ncbi:hypothetical protein MRB53_025936 [Persea americana]|uniref:Uncharacterized protein n=1 Tax=Persea americana TaxID=3435 RepID=A0ACC2LH71_PERAE|nr:hypothetical protein MRB53_025936 [Persea americana]
MGILFGGTQARGEETWTPSSASFPEDLNTQMPSPPPHIDNTQNNTQEETFEDISTEELMTNATRKRPCPSQSRRDVRKNQIDENFKRLVIILEDDRKEKGRKREEHKEEERKEEKRKEEARKEEERKEEERKRGPTMQECIDILKQIPNVQATSELYFFGTRAFKDKDNRDIFMSFESNDAHLYWLNMITKHGP